MPLTFTPIAGERKTGPALLAILAALALPALISGCAQIRKATYPSNFVYLDSQQVRGEMALLSLYMRQIDEMLADSTRISSEQQQQLIKTLVSMDEVTNRLAAGSVETNHLTIDDNIDRFKQDVNVALRDASSDPPNYFALGRLAGSCTACHRYR